MSELIDTRDNRATIRWKLLTGASALALAAYMSSVAVAKAEDANQPLLWLEFGGQWERQTGQGHVYTPQFIADNPDSLAFNPVSPLQYERAPLYGEGMEGALTFQPHGSDWQFSASIRYGRSSSSRSANPGHHITRIEHGTAEPKGKRVGGVFVVSVPPVMETFDITAAEFAPVHADNKQTHAIMDFTAGRDVGLGIFGHDVSGTISAGVRFAQFQSNTSATIHARPDAEFGYISLGKFVHLVDHVYPSLPFLLPNGVEFHTYAATFRAQREFRGVGPSISWNASTPVAGHSDDESLTVDWGINAALLFGRQRVRGSHYTSGHYKAVTKTSGNYATGAPFTRSRRVTIPNAGGMIGMSLRFPNAKISIGYRGDFFFGAMDTGNDTRRTGRTGFYGPFASISFGLGD